MAVKQRGPESDMFWCFMLGNNILLSTPQDCTHASHFINSPFSIPNSIPFYTTILHSSFRPTLLYTPVSISLSVIDRKINLSY